MYLKFYAGIQEELQKLQKIPPDASVKFQDIKILLEMLCETLDKHRRQIQALEKRVKGLEERQGEVGKG